MDDSSDEPLYRPGNEPEAIKRRLVSLFEKLDAAYPDKVVVGLHNDHKKWVETVTELYRKLGYEIGAAFLKTYGYTVVAKTGKGGRPASVAPEDIIAFLKDKYEDGPIFEGLNELIADNPELAGNLKTINNKSNELLGTSLKAYLIQQGILLDASIRREKECEEVTRQRDCKARFYYWISYVKNVRMIIEGSLSNLVSEGELRREGRGNSAFFIRLV